LKTPSFSTTRKGFFVRAQKGTCQESDFYIYLQQKHVLDCLKQAQDSKGIILRLYEAKSTRGVVDVCLSFPFSKVYECNMMEVNERELPCGNGCFNFKISPNEVKTFRII
jgi:alpha-mannosidase